MIRIICLLVLAVSSFGVTTTSIDCSYGGTTIVNKVLAQFATTATEAQVTVTVSPGHPVTLEFVNDGGDSHANANAWYYRTTTSDTAHQRYLAADQSLKLRFTVTQTFFVVRSSADGKCSATVLLQE